MLIISVIVLVALQACSAHIVLTFPPARKYALDFLDNLRTIAPCGVPRGKVSSLCLFVLLKLFLLLSLICLSVFISRSWCLYHDEFKL